MHLQDTIQTVIVFIIVAAAFAYASWRAYKALTSKDNTCAGCPLKDSCKKNGRKMTGNSKTMRPENC